MIDRVRISGSSKETRSVVVSPDAEAEVASLFVGAKADGFGVLTVRGSLKVDRSEQSIDSQAGRATVGRGNGRGYLVVDGGDVSAESVWLGVNQRSYGELFLADGTLTVSRSLNLTGGINTSGMLELRSGGHIETKRLLIGRGNARIRFEVDGQNDVPTIQVSGRSELAGLLSASVAGESLPNEVVLIANDGTTSGGFRRVRVSSPDSTHYEITYSGGDGNDVALRKTPQVNSFEEWRAAHNLAVNPFDDPDADGVPNVGEYKLGCCAVTSEGAAFRQGTNAVGEAFIHFVERTDRTDVRTVPQWSKDGRVWTSEGLSTRVTSKRGNTRVVRVTSNRPNGEFRLLFELLPQPDVRPNVLFVTIDDLNDWIEPLGGHPQCLTPNLNRIASRGVLFTEAHAPAVLCNPSRVAILTGRHPASTGVYDNQANLRDSPVLQNAITIPENFKADGYHISGAGKVFHRNPQIEQWDDYFPSKTKNRPGSPEPEGVPLNGITDSHGRFDWGPVGAANEQMGDYLVASWIRERLATPESDEPFFLARIIHGSLIEKAAFVRRSVC